MRILYLVVVLLVAILAVVFAAQNGAVVALSFFSWSASGSLSLVIILTLSIGILLGVLVMLPAVFKRSLQASGLRRRMSRLEKEKATLSERVSAADAAQASQAQQETKAAPAQGQASPPEQR